ncbi:hypothetical protein NDU88_004655 [Pleurodeles waltl]|uniref:Uncharacterized protein n=1 Tax=Pleurodeles waltl TaxID=8319 RepID=A0AAV7NLN4_PLEWA|nr:hypothetical protein NDU88_004655 [Pleurodeles waltl]
MFASNIVEANIMGPFQQIKSIYINCHIWLIHKQSLCRPACDGPTLSSDPPYSWGTGRAELPDPEVLGAGTNPKELPGDGRKKRDSSLRPEGAGGAGEERDDEGEEHDIGSRKGGSDGPADSARAGGQRP